MKWIMGLGRKPKYISFQWDSKSIMISNLSKCMVWIGTDRNVDKTCGIPLQPVPHDGRVGGRFKLTKVSDAPIRGLYLIADVQDEDKANVEVEWDKGS